MAHGDVEAGKTPLVSILTYCAHPSLAYGTLLIFKTLRTGFPTARIEVFDNGSHPDVRARIEHAAADVGATFTAMTLRHFSDHLRWVLLEREHDGNPLVLLDPDIAFWRRVQDWDFGHTLMAGRLIPQLGKAARIGMPRLHPSLLWVPDVERLRSEASRSVPSGTDLVAQKVENSEGQVQVFDTMAALYQALKDQCTPFDEAQLDCYDHLFYGSHLPMLSAGLDGMFKPIRDGHEAAASGDLAGLRGIWRVQQAMFEGRIASTSPVSRSVDLITSVREIQRWQCLDFDDDELLQGCSALARALNTPRNPGVHDASEATP